LIKADNYAELTKRLAVALVTKQAAILWGVIVRQRSFLAQVMTRQAGFLRLFFAFYGKKRVVNIIMGEGGSRFLRGLEKKNENSGTDDNEYRIDQEQLFSAFFLHCQASVIFATKSQ
jgi:hypothetical protein